ncbi:DNA repair protein RadC [Acetobacteraceae bacterium ESL0709]|nr:DNA repair protein RadC [Acetobacteraceae bacterium ESL0697]MDF7678021.1 DNA repair protein RadC [Acetobacteraceae bacterium ESL0709]
MSDGTVFPENLLEQILDSQSDLADRECIFAYIVDLCCKSGKDRERLMTLLLGNYTNLAHLLCMSRHERDVLGIRDQNFFVSLRLFREAALRFNQASLPSGDLIHNERLLINYLTTCMARERVEQFRVLFLDKQNGLILDEVQGKGTVNQTAVYPREITRRCRELHASAVILAHNHPSGTAKPSEADVIMTQQVQQALSLIKVNVLDHYIIARSTWSSFRALGLL